MLSEEEKAICRSIISYMDLENIHSLAQTVTLRNVKVVTLEEAVDAIAMYSRSLEEFLRRRKVKREHIFQYVIKKEPFVPSTMEKEQLIRKIITSLNFKGSNNEGGDEAAAVSTTDEEVSPAVSTNVSQTVQNTEGQLLAEYFVPWFFNLINSLHIGMKREGETDEVFGVHHFWKESSLSIEYINDQQTDEETVHGAQLLCDFYTKLVFWEHLLFNPSLSSTQGKMDSHGLVTVFVSGTFHKDSDPRGVFEKVIGLVRDPLMQNNWKVKFVRLRLKGHVRESTPSLQN